jgi:hypothetical protein
MGGKAVFAGKSMREKERRYGDASTQISPHPQLCLSMKPIIASVRKNRKFEIRSSSLLFSRIFEPKKDDKIMYIRFIDKNMQKQKERKMTQSRRINK